MWADERILGCEICMQSSEILTCNLPFVPLWLGWFWQKTPKKASQFVFKKKKLKTLHCDVPAPSHPPLVRLSQVRISASVSNCEELACGPAFCSADPKPSVSGVGGLPSSELRSERRVLQSHQRLSRLYQAVRSRRHPLRRGDSGCAGKIWK